MEVLIFEEKRKETGLSKRMLAMVLYTIHILVTLLIAFGWMSPWDIILWCVVITYAATEILWATRQGFCILTDVERWLLEIDKPDSALQQNFIHRIIKNTTGRSLDPKFARNLTVTIGRFSFMASLFRLAVPGI